MDSNLRDLRSIVSTIVSTILITT